MTIDKIDAFLQKCNFEKQMIKISFKSRRETLTGIFIKTNDYDELKEKNFWRFVNQLNMNKYKKSPDINLSRIFNGTDIVKLSLYNHSAE